MEKESWLHIGVSRTNINWARRKLKFNQHTKNNFI
uniref:Uncharacterized protein n=1 Tax=Arundo donax TaxID=35708 RepID=A0A0A8YZR3_ARUDO